MYLKKMNIAGFKSFPEKQELHFSPGITAIVGPNGCGKSNIVDALRWVLGEQSVKLMRGTRMEDLIFNGTSRRKPLNYADVSLTFDMADSFLPVDYREIVITRRMYRSGESEYFINKSSCRLKDITELFLDTGIGVETYSLIGQGRVEKLINARPEENRELFEEAAEIHKYKQRKKEATAKLDEMKRNLLRVEDLLAELLEQQGLLAQEVKRAREYKAYHERLKAVERKILFKRLSLNEGSLKKVNNKIERVQEKIREREIKVEDFKRAIDKLANEEKIKQKETEDLDKVLLEHRDEMNRNENKLILIAEQEKHLEERKKLKEDSFREMEIRISGLQESCSKNELELKKVRNEQEQLASRAAFLKEELLRLQDKQEVSLKEKLLEEVSRDKLKMASLEQFRKINCQRCQELEEKIKELANRLSKKEKELEVIENVESEMLALLQRVKMEIDEKYQESKLLQNRKKEITRLIQEKREEISKIERELERKKASIQYLRESEESFAYYSKGVKAVMKFSRDSAEEGIYGPVAKLIDVSPEYEKAIEVALGAAAQYIVTSGDQQARKAINYLKANRAGRATFLPLNMLKTLPKDKYLSLNKYSNDSVLGIASNLVKVSAKYKKAVDYLLGGVIVTRDLEESIKLANDLKGGWKIVTLEGEMISPGGAISGGYMPGERGGFLRRKRELNETLSELKNYERQYEHSYIKLKELEKQRESLELDIEELQQSLNKLEKLKLMRENEIARIQEDKGRIFSDLEYLKTEKKVFEERLEIAEAEGAAKNKEQELLKKALFQKEEELNAVSRKLQQVEETCKSLENELVNVRVCFSAFQEKESTLQQVLANQKGEKEHLIKLKNKLSREREELEEEIKQIVLVKKEINLLIKNTREKQKCLKEQREHLANILRKIQDEKKNLIFKLSKEEAALQRSATSLHSLKLELVKLKEEGKYLQEQLREKFRVNPESIQEEIAESDESIIRERDELEAKLSSMGEVDLGIIDEFERLEKRISFLKEQRKDLLEGEKGVKNILLELERHMEKRFLEAFRSIETNFTDIFKGIFGGGQAFLKLTQPENILESGIEIVAQPPGKNLQNISLLSSGEKALTVIALLFALLKFRPVPFCVLDEVDSSLDDNNLTKFLHFLKIFSKDTQFILITHRKMTMEVADVLYGITMEEQGVSKIVSVDLSKKAG